MAKLRGALFGCGMISEFHLRGWQRIPEVEMVALGNRTVEKAEQRRQEFAPHARVYDDLGTMLATETLDFIDILTPPALHRSHCELAMQAGVGVICQKPLCDRWDDAQALTEQARGYGRLFAVHENHRYRPWFQQVRQQFQEGRFGKIHLLRLEHLNATAPTEAYKNEAHTGILLEYGSHLIDMMRSLLGEPQRVLARLHHLHPGVHGESLAHLTYEYADATATIETAWKSAHLTQGSMLLVGDRGEACYEGTLTRGDAGRLRVTEGDRLLVDEAVNPYQEYVESFYLFERECVDAMLGRGTIVQTVDEHLRTLRCTFRAYEAAESGMLIEV